MTRFTAVGLRSAVLFLLVFSAGTFAANLIEVTKPPAAQRHPTRILLRQKSLAIAGSRPLSAIVPTARVLREFTAVPGLSVLEVPPQELQSAIDRLRADPSIEYAEPDFIIQVDAVPNDTSYQHLWGLRNVGQTVFGDPGTTGFDIRAEGAWDIWTGDPQFKVAVIDTGINYSHPDLIANLWTNYKEIESNGIDDDENGWIDDIHGYNTALDIGVAVDNLGHGSHVSGTIAAHGNNGAGVTGVNWRCSLVALRFTDDKGSGFTSDAIEALQYVVDNDIKISNSSWGCYECYSQALYDAIAATQAIGHIFVTSAGNGFLGLGVHNEEFPQFPASYDLPNIIAVAAINNDGEKAKFSNYGRFSVDLAAPGVTILSTLRGSAYGYFNGTSMAAPHVTGVTALLMSRRPDLPWQRVKERVLATARPLPSMERITVTGGLVDAQAAVGDCNRNGIEDEHETGQGLVADCNANEIPDECEPDCNGNDVADGCDIDHGASADCNGNRRPDECEPDCNGNIVADECDIVSGFSGDCNDSGVPDECEGGSDHDCNGNGLSDLCDLYNGTSTDCNHNNTPDDCDIANGLSQDCSRNGLPDECERDCNANGSADSCDIAHGVSLDFNGDGVPDECTLGFALTPVGARGFHTIEGQEITVVEGGEQVTLEIRISGWDLDQDGEPRLRFYQAGIATDGFTSGDAGELAFATIPCKDDEDCLGESRCTPAGECDAIGSLVVVESHPDFVFAGSDTISLTDALGHRLGSTLFYHTLARVDTGLTKYAGTVVLDVSTDAGGVFTVNFNDLDTFFGDPDNQIDTIPVPGFVPVRIRVAPDCNLNAIPDEVDIAAGLSEDCDLNGIPDECIALHFDCNRNQVPDYCDTQSGASPDCNGNSVPDECIERELDCNRNRLVDACEIDAGEAPDCNENGIIDTCIALEDDCNGNFEPDACDIERKVSHDCNANGAPDECDRDCNRNGFADECDIADGRSHDLDHNTYPDECQSNLHVPGMFPSIQAALNAAENGDVVILADGVYSGPGNRDLDYRGNDIILRSENGPRLCVLDAEGGQRGVYFSGAEGANARLEGVTVTRAVHSGVTCLGSKPTIRNCYFLQNGPIAAGILLDQGSDALIEGCSIFGNTAGFDGGGIRVVRSNPTIRDCIISNNNAGRFGGGIYSLSSRCVVENCRIINNLARNGGGGLAAIDGNPDIRACLITGNSAAAITGFIGDGGGLHLVQTDALINSSLITGNFARRHGGGVYMEGGDPTFGNCSIIGNRARNSGGGIYKWGNESIAGACCFFGGCEQRVNPEGCAALGGTWYAKARCFDLVCGTRTCCRPDGTCTNTFSIDCAIGGGAPGDVGTQCATWDCTPSVRNSILWDNTAAAGRNLFSADAFLTITQSILHQAWYGEGLFDMDPRFVAPGAWQPGDLWTDGDYRLTPDSPAINAGLDQWLWPGFMRDLTGHARSLCGATDLGAYEFGLGDYDCNQIVDLNDFQGWSKCFAGTEAASAGPGCEIFDGDADGDVDLADYARFQNELSQLAP